VGLGLPPQPPQPPIPNPQSPIPNPHKIYDILAYEKIIFFNLIN